MGKVVRLLMIVLRLFHQYSVYLHHEFVQKR